MRLLCSLMHEHPKAVKERTKTESRNWFFLEKRSLESRIAMFCSCVRVSRRQMSLQTSSKIWKRKTRHFWTTKTPRSFDHILVVLRGGCNQDQIYLALDLCLFRDRKRRVWSTWTALWNFSGFWNLSSFYISVSHQNIFESFQDSIWTELTTTVLSCLQMHLGDPKGVFREDLALGMLCFGETVYWKHVNACKPVLPWVLANQKPLRFFKLHRKGAAYANWWNFCEQVVKIPPM